jgi:hypothetical protein
MMMVFLGDKFFKHLFDFAFTGFHSKFDRQGISGIDPDLIGGICDDPGFDPGLAFRAISFEDVGKRWSKLFQAVWNLHLTRIPVYSGVDFFQPEQSKYDIFRTEVCDKEIGGLVS